LSRIPISTKRTEEGGKYGRTAAPLADNVENSEDGFAGGGLALLKRLRLN
jgi:hypothetical protein